MGVLYARIAGTLALVTALAAPVCAQAPQADATLPLFTVMAAAAALSDPAGPSTTPLAQQLRKELTGKDLPSLVEIRRFLSTVKGSLPVAEQNDPVRSYSRLVSFALVIDGPPAFEFRIRESELPPDAVVLMGLNPLLKNFYEEAQLEKLWFKYQTTHQEVAAQYQDGIARVMLEVNGYLRNSTAGFLGRTFSVYVDALGPPNQVNARSFGSDYYVVVSPSTDLQLNELRHGYLHYVLEPLASKHGALLRERQELLRTAQRATALDPVLRGDFKLFFTESLIRAAELRMVKTPKGAPDAERQKRLDEAAAEGHFLVPYFYEALEKFEQQEAGIRLYYPTLVQKLEVRREERRAEQIVFRTTPSPRRLSEVNVIAARLAGITDELERMLAEGEDAIARQDYAGARQAYRSALERSTSGAASKESGRARALYGLALVATQEKQPEVAKNYFQQTLEAAREPQLLAWAHIYLGRLLDMENRRDLAMHHYRQALEAGEIGSATRKAAQKGLDAPFQKSKEGGLQ